MQQHKSKDAPLARKANLKVESALAVFAKRLIESGAITAEPSVEAQIQKVVVENPTMSIATFLNTLKSMGLKIDKAVSETNVTPQKSEADSSSGFPQLTREKNIAIKTNQFFESATTGISADRPRDTTTGFTKFGVILIQEGLGNLGTTFFYTKEALKSAVQLFEGRKCYADHPTTIEEEIRPERSVRDILGYFKNVQYRETESGRGQVVADLSTPPTPSFEWARTLMTTAVQFSKEFPDKDFVGLSINASGDASPSTVRSMIESDLCQEVKAKLIEADKLGITDVNVVYKFDDAISCDLVTEAGAAGKIKTLMEGDKTMKTKAQKEAEAKSKREAADQAQSAVAKLKEGKPTAKALKEAEEKAAAALKEAETAEAAAKEGDGAPAHADADQDAALIQKMISKYMGDSEKPSEEECGIVKEAYEACKEMGMDEAEAEKQAVNSLKMSKHMAQKQAKKEADEKAKKEADEAAAKAKAEADAKAGGEGDKDKKESSAKITELEGEVKKLKESNTTLQAEKTALEQKLGQYDLQNHIEKICKESGLKTEVTKKFREAVKEAKSVAEVDGKWKTWKSAYDAVNETVTVHNFSESIAVNGEKQTSSGGGGSFADSITT